MSIRPGVAKSLGSIWMMTMAACGPPPIPQMPSWDPLPEPDPANVESVIFLLGDAGDVVSSSSPVLTRLTEDVEWWSDELERDSAVAVLVLGDIIYPNGMRDPGTPEYDRDTAIVLSQTRVVSGEQALEHKAHMYFMAGNHDWGRRMHWEGFVRLKNLDDYLESVRAWSGASVYLVPEAGAGGPHVVDWGDHLRLILLDTAWWLLSADEVEKQGVLSRIEEAFETAGDREIALAAHHPFKSGGPHGGGISIWELIGVRYILHRSGAILQDVTSEPYRALESGLRGIFARHEPPLGFFGGHEHSLQVVLGVEPTDPEFSLISGSGSKLSEIGPEAGLVFGRSAPGYMKVVIEKDGGVTLYVEATRPEFLACEAVEVGPSECLQEGLAAMETVYSRRLR